MDALPALSGAHGDPPDAVRVGGDVTTFSALAAAADRIAARIAGAHAVAVRATPSLPVAAVIVGALRAGVPIVPAPHDASDAEIAYLLADSGATLLDGSGAPVGAPDGVPATPVRTAASDRTGITPDTALILYTSGTTGRPKGVQLSAAALAANLDALADAWAWTPDDLLVHGLPWSHVHGLVLGLLGPLRVGSRVAHTVRPTPQAYARAAGTLYFGVPTVWSRICAAPDAARALSGARLLVSGSAALPAPVFDAMEALTGQRPIERYGMTETLITCSARADGPRVPNRVGVPLPGVMTRLAPFDDQDDDQDDDRAGDQDDDRGGRRDAGARDARMALGALEVRTPSAFAGYLGRPDATAAAHAPDDWFRTGDIAAVDPDGMHRIVGRAAIDLIKTGGYRVGAGEVEDALLAHPAVREAAVVGRPDDDLGQRIVAYVVADGVDAAALAEFAASRLSRHKAPRQIVFLDALPRNAMGKVRKASLG